MIRTYPQAAGKSLRIQLDCPNPPSTQVAGLIEPARQYRADYKIGFVVNVLD